MKKAFLLGFVAITSVLAITSCKTDIDLTGDYKQVPIVVGVLNQADSIQYVRVNRTFLGPGDANQIAQIADSNYFTNIELTITETINGNSRVWTLRDTTIEDKEPGSFYTSPNIVYYFQVDPNESHNINSQTSQLNPDAQYRLDLVIDGGAKRYYATTNLVSGASITAPSSSAGMNFNSFQSGSSVAIQAKDVLVGLNVGNGARLDYEYVLDYDEHTASGVERVRKTYNFMEESFEGPGFTASTTLGSNSMYSWLETVVPNDPDVLKRSIVGAGINVHIASEAFNQYIIASQPVSSLSQTKPTYTNIIEIVTNDDGTVTENNENAIGFFGSRATVSYYKYNVIPSAPDQTWGRVFNEATLRGHMNLGLGFCSAHSFDNTKPYYCP